MKRLLCTVSVLICILLTACGEAASIGIIGGADGPTAVLVSEKGEEEMYKQITPDEAKKIMDSGESFVILDVRDQEEYDSGHIPGARLIPYTEIESRASDVLPDKEMQILVYCRSGRRSKIASQVLAELGYINIKEFGGILDWQYDIEK